jgi:PAS domain S-box-containing protein
MGVMADATGHALADVALALAASANRVDAVLRVAARAAAEMIGDGGVARLAGDEAPTVHHPDRDRIAPIAEALRGSGSALLRTAREPIVLATRAGDGLGQPVPPDYRADLEHAGISACLLFPLIVDGTYLGYLGAVRTTPDGVYTAADLDLAFGIAGEVGLALANVESAARLRVAEERYRRIVEITPDGVWQLDPDGVTTFVNQPMASMLGLPREQLLGLSAHGFLDDQGQTQLPRWLVQCRDGQTGVHQARLVRADGSIQPVRISAAPVPSDQGQTGFSLWLVSDAADQLQARGLKRQLDHLRRLDSLGQLIGDIAHDFNNLLTVLAGTAEVIASETEPGSTPHRLAVEIVDGATRGRTLAHQLLAFGRGGGKAVSVSIPDLLDDVTQLLSRTLGEHIQLNIAAEAGVWSARAERGPLEQVLINLAANARDAMRRGGTLTVRASNVTIEPGELDDTDLAGRFVQVSVADTGAGMDEATLDRALEAFYTTKPAAAGLGLTTAASIIRSGGGHIGVDSEPRLGTTVTLLLPAADEPTPAPAPAPAPPNQAQPEKPHILVVEDQAELAQLIRHLLQRAGYPVTVATDPRAVPEDVEPDLLLTDVVMPGMTGPEFAATLRQRHPALRVLYMSGYAAAALDPESGPDDTNLIQKPFNRETLLAAVERAWR